MDLVLDRVVDLRRLFRDLATKKDNFLDNGMVIGGVSASDLAHVKEIEGAAAEKEAKKE